MKSAKQNLGGQAKVFLLSTEGVIAAFSSEQDARDAMADGDVLFGSPAS